jgi:enoyl-CoA hydratase
MPSNIQIEQLGAVRRIWLNRPEMRNAQNKELLDELDLAFSQAEEDPNTNVILLAGRGAHFSAGHDLKQAQAERSSFSVEERWAYESKRYFGYCMRIWDCPKPTVVQVQGACIGGGFMLANMFDLIVASEDAFFSDPVTHTMGAASLEVLIHPWVLGLRNAKELLFTGRKLTAQEAKQMGMVNKVVPNDQLEDAALKLAHSIALAPTFAVQLVKRSLNRSMDASGMRQALSAHFDVHQLSHVTNEYKKTNSKGLSAAIDRGAKA